MSTAVPLAGVGKGVRSAKPLLSTRKIIAERALRLYDEQREINLTKEQCDFVIAIIDMTRETERVRVRETIQKSVHLSDYEIRCVLSELFPDEGVNADVY